MITNWRNGMTVKACFIDSRIEWINDLNCLMKKKEWFKQSDIGDDDHIDDDLTCNKQKKKDANIWRNIIVLNSIYIHSIYI